MSSNLTRRDFLKAMLAAQAGLGLLPAAAAATQKDQPFSFVILGDLHYDKLEHHDLGWLEKDKPDDVRQVRDYTRITVEIMPKLFATLRRTIADLQGSEMPVRLTVQVGDLVEGLCGNEALARLQNKDVVKFLSAAALGVPFLFTKGNHDVTGPAAVDAFKSVFHPFLAEEATRCDAGASVTSARYDVRYGNAQFYFFDAYERDSLGWLESALARRTAQHCFVILHPPVAPYGARSTWNIFSAQREQSSREHLLGLLGKNHAFVLTGHIHKYNLLVRTTPGGGRFLQFAISSVVPALEVTPQRLLEGPDAYNPDQVKVEPDFSPATEKQRRAVYQAEAPFVRQFQYADLPGYVVLGVSGPKVTAKVYSGVSRKLWRSLDLSDLLRS